MSDAWLLFFVIDASLLVVLPGQRTTTSRLRQTTTSTQLSWKGDNAATSTPWYWGTNLPFGITRAPYEPYHRRRTTRAPYEDARENTCAAQLAQWRCSGAYGRTITDGPCKWVGGQIGCQSCRNALSGQCCADGDCEGECKTQGGCEGDNNVSVPVILVVLCILVFGGAIVAHLHKQNACPSQGPPPAPRRDAPHAAPTSTSAVLPILPPLAATAKAVVRPVPARSSLADPTAMMVVPATGLPPVKFEPMKIPSYWETHEGVHIVPAPEMIEDMQKLMTNTWKVKYTRDRKLAGGSGTVPKGCRVTNVLRVENHAAYNKTWKKKQEVRARRRQVERTFTTASTLCSICSGKLNKLEPDVNEVYLFHGTSPPAAESIARKDFNIARAGSSTGMMFGPGIYLAENSSKSDEYAKEGEGLDAGQHAMLICRAVAGKVLTVTDAGDYSGKVTSREYDSVCGDRLTAAGTFREMVFYQEEAVYAEYIAIYVREQE